MANRLEARRNSHWLEPERGPYFCASLRTADFAGSAFTLFKLFTVKRAASIPKTVRRLLKKRNRTRIDREILPIQTVPRRA